MRVLDTLTARLFAVTVSAVLAAALLYGGLSTIAGVWAQPSLDRSGLMATAAAVTRIITSSPASLRPQLAAAASTRQIRIAWLPSVFIAAPDNSAAVRDRTPKHPEQFQDLAAVTRRILCFAPRDPVDVVPGLQGERRRSPGAYLVLAQLPDGSWLYFLVHQRLWGPGSAWTAMVQLLLLGLSAIVVAAIAARQLSRPAKALADELKAYGANAGSRPIPQHGPAELREIIGEFNAMKTRIHGFIVQRTLMLATISHDLRTPLTRLRLRSETLPDPWMGERFKSDIQEMAQMIDATLTLFQDEHVGDEPFTKLDLCALVGVIADDHADRGEPVSFAPSGSATCRGKPVALKRAITNLVQNALRHGGSAEVLLSRSGSAITLEVRDDGPGVPDPLLEHIFQPFTRVDKTAPAPGTGLGLTSARTIVHSHGGTIRARNRPSGGLSLVVTLPAMREGAG
jgi:signal transduction histidine kinase